MKKSLTLKIKKTLKKSSDIVIIIIIFLLSVIFFGNIGFLIAIIIFQFIFNYKDIKENYVSKDEYRLRIQKSDEAYIIYKEIEEDYHIVQKENQKLKHKLEKAIYKIGCQKKELRKLNKINGA